MADKEQYLTLSDGRILAYEEIGDKTSTTLVIFFHGMLGVGSAPRQHPIFRERGIHYIAPTLPGWGNSSPRPHSLSFAACITSSTTELIKHLHPETISLRIYVSGGSYGTVPAQILYGAPFDALPLGRNIVGCLLLAPFSPFRWHSGYAKCLSWPDYISVGAPGLYTPFRLIPRLIYSVVKSKASTIEGAETLLRQVLFDKASPEERESFMRWREQNEIPEGQLERDLAANAMKSISKGNAGILELPEAIHSDWGFKPDTLDEEHRKRPVLCVVSSHDPIAGLGKWLSQAYANGLLKTIEGGHIASLYQLDDIWKEFVESVEGGPTAE